MSTVFRTSYLTLVIAACLACTSFSAAQERQPPGSPQQDNSPSPSDAPLRANSSSQNGDSNTARQPPIKRPALPLSQQAIEPATPPSTSPPSTSPPSTSPPSPQPQPPQDISPAVQRQVSRATNSRAQFQTSNLFARGSGRINIMSDLFGVAQNQLTVTIPYSFSNILGEGQNFSSFGFDVGGNGDLDLFSTGPPDANGTYRLAEPLPTSGAPMPTAPGLQFLGGNATDRNPLDASDAEKFFDLVYSYSTTLSLPSGSGLLLGRQKMAANVSPIPHTRIFTDYSFFDHTSLVNGLDVHRWTPGFEYAFGEGLCSVEVRLPMGVTSSSDIFSENAGDRRYELGNLFLAWKSILLERKSWLVSGGLSINIPTADDLNYFLGSNGGTSQHVLQIRNESVQLQPFVGWYAQERRLFTQGFAQLDLDVNGSSVLINPGLTQAPLSHLGVVQNTNLLYVDMQIGYWLRRYDQGNAHQTTAGLTGFAPVWELHINRSLQAADVVGSTADGAGSGGIQIGSPLADVQLLNTVLGVMVERNFDTQLYLGYATPIGNGADAAFDGELRISLNRYF